MKKDSLTKPMALIGAIVFTVEAVTMTALQFIPFDIGISVEILLDSIVLTVVSVLLIYWLSIKPYSDKKRELIDNLTKIQAELLEANKELKFQQYALNKHAIVSITDVQGKITYANDKFCEISGYSRDELLGENHRILSSGNHSKEFFTDLWETIAKGKTWQGEIENKTKTGSSYWLSATIVPYLNSRGKPIRYLAIRRDITKQKEVTNNLAFRTLSEQEARVQAEEANEAKSRFLASMSHDLRTPLNAIIGFSDMMKTEAFGVLGHSKYKEYANDINNSGALLLNMINDILDIAKVEAGKYELHEEALNLKNVIDGSISQLALAAQSANLKINTEIPPHMPSLFGDRRIVIQMLNNLLSNAIKFTPEAGVITVRAFVDDSKNLLAIEVADTGIGFNKDDVKRLMDPFVQIDNSYTRRHKGTGLGLHLCKNFMELFGGKFMIESEKGVGTKASLLFPKYRIGRDTATDQTH